MTEKHQHFVDLWLAGIATTEQTDWLWAEALNDETVLDYMKTAAGAQKVLALQSEKKATKNTVAQVHSLKYWYLSAAMVLIAVVLGFLLKINRNPYEVAISSIELIELQSPNITRSTVNEISAADSLLNLGIKAVVDGKKKRAIELFEKLLAEYSDQEWATSIAHFNLGIVHFNSGKFEDALQSFNIATESFSHLQDEEMLEKSMWFKAHSLANLNKLEEAQDEAARVFHLNGTFKKQALLFAKRIDQKLKHKKFEDDFVAE